MPCTVDFHLGVEILPVWQWFFKLKVPGSQMDKIKPEDIAGISFYLRTFCLYLI